MLSEREWQPIETAPKMRTVLLFAVTDRDEHGRVRNWKMGTGFYHEGWTDGREHRLPASPWSWEGRHIEPWEPLPTHWMPLPRPPAEDDKRALAEAEGRDG